jgi:hypothetical protein
MKRLFIIGLIIAWAIPFAYAQNVSEDAPKEIRLTVTPAGEPKPAMKYLLLPEPLDRKRGNAAMLYLKPMKLLDDKKLDPYRKKLGDWLKLPANELPRSEIQKMLDAYRVSLRQAELASRRSYCDFELPISEGIEMQLPSLGRLRELAKVLILKIRLEIADGKINQTMHDFQTGFAMARHLDNGVTLIEDLVAIAIASLFAEELENFMQTIDSPNLYWAMASLPQPMIDIHKAMELESAMLYFEIPKLREKNLEKATPEECEKILKKIMGFMKLLSDQEKGKSTLDISKLYPEAKRYLLSHGFNPEKIKDMPTEKAVLIYMNKTYLIWRDDMFKWINLPYWQAREGAEQANVKFSKWLRGKGNTNILLYLLPSPHRVYFMQARSQRQFAALQTIEAVRMFAANHGGKLPDKLGDISEAPAPIDPVLGKPFGYKVEGNTFTLDAPAPAGMKQKEGRRYIVTLKNKKAN